MVKFIKNTLKYREPTTRSLLTMISFPADIRKRMWMALDVGKQIPADVILQYLDSPGGKAFSSYHLGDLLQRLAPDRDFRISRYLNLLKQSGLIEPQRDYATRLPLHSYFLTKAGRTYGWHLSQAALSWVNQNHTSLTAIFGTTMGFPRGTYKRYQILDDLYGFRNQGPMRKTHLAYDVGVGRASEISKDLETLSREGLVDCTIELVEEKVVKHSRFKGGAREALTLPGVERDVAQSLLQGNLSIATITQHTGYKTVTVLNALRSLHDQDRIQALDWVVNHRKYEVSLTDQGTKFWQEFLQPLEDVLMKSEKTLDLERKKFNPRLAERAMQIYAQHFFSEQPSETAAGKKRKKPKRS